MSVLSWGKPIVEIVAADDGAIPAVPTWVPLPVIKENTAKLTPTKGSKREATGEGGELVDVVYNKSKYVFECDIFCKKGDSKPIADDDGAIVTLYCIRLTPEDDTIAGWIMENTRVSVDESWSSADGKMWKYTFEGLKPASGAILKTYTKAGA